MSTPQMYARVAQERDELRALCGELEAENAELVAALDAIIVRCEGSKNVRLLDCRQIARVARAKARGEQT